MGKLYLYILIIALVASCKPRKLKDKTSEPLQLEEAGVFILNEGNFNSGNASVSLYNINSGKIEENVYYKVNNKQLGDVCQSMTLFQGKYYLVVNNSGKIEVLDTADFKSTATITGMNSPRYFLGLSPNKAYVTDLFANKIHILNLLTNTVSGSISLRGWTEELVLYNNKVYVTNLNSRYLYVIDPSVDQLIDSVEVGYGSGSLCVDKNGIFWTACTGDASLFIYPSITSIDPVTLSVIERWEEDSYTKQLFKLRINQSKDRLLYIGSQGIYQVNINDSGIPSKPLIAASGKNFYGLRVDPVNADLYVADAIDFVQKSTIYRFDSTGQVITNFKAGINSGDFFFKNGQ